MERPRILHDVSEVLKRAGFQTRPGDRGLALAATPDGVLVEWQPDPALLHPMMQLAHGEDSEVPDTVYGDGIKQVMTTAVAALLEQAGFQVRAVEAGLEVTDPARSPAVPSTATRYAKAIGYREAQSEMHRESNREANREASREASRSGFDPGLMI